MIDCASVRTIDRETVFSESKFNSQKMQTYFPSCLIELVDMNGDKIVKFTIPCVEALLSLVSKQLAITDSEKRMQLRRPKLPPLRGYAILAQFTADDQELLSVRILYNSFFGCRVNRYLSCMTS